MSLMLYGLKNCDTCKKALKALEASGQTVEFIDIRSEADLATKLPVWLASAGSDRLMNTRSTTWRNLDDQARASDPQALMQAHPTLIKRPVIEAGDAIHVGWAKPVQAALLADG